MADLTDKGSGCKIASCGSWCNVCYVSKTGKSGGGGAITSVEYAW